MIKHLEDIPTYDNEWGQTGVRKPNIRDIQDKINEVIDAINELLGDDK